MQEGPGFEPINPLVPGRPAVLNNPLTSFIQRTHIYVFLLQTWLIGCRCPHPEKQTINYVNPTSPYSCLYSEQRGSCLASAPAEPQTLTRREPWLSAAVNPNRTSRPCRSLEKPTHTLTVPSPFASLAVCEDSRCPPACLPDWLTAWLTPYWVFLWDTSMGWDRWLAGLFQRSSCSTAL